MLGRSCCALRRGPRTRAGDGWRRWVEAGLSGTLPPSASFSYFPAPLPSRRLLSSRPLPSVTPSFASSMQRAELEAAILRAKSVDALLSLHSQHSFSFTGPTLWQALWRLTRLTDPLYRRSVGLQSSLLATLSDSRFDGFLEHIRHCLHPATSLLSLLSLLEALTAVLFRLTVEPADHWDGQGGRSTGQRLSKPTILSRVVQWPPAAPRLLTALLDGLTTHRRVRRPSEAARLLLAADQLLRSGQMSHQLPQLLSSALSELEAADAAFFEALSLNRLRDLCRALTQLAKSLEPSPAATSLQRKLCVQVHTRVAALQTAPPDQLLCFVAFVAAFNLREQWPLLELLLSFLHPRVQLLSPQHVAQVCYDLSTLGYYHEPLLLAVAAHVVVSLRGPSKAVWDTWAKSPAAYALHTFAKLRVAPHHPLVLTFFALVLDRMREPDYQRKVTTTAVWSVAAMLYHERGTEEEKEKDVWADVSLPLTVLLVGQQGVGPSAAAVQVRAAHVARMRAKVVKALERLVAAVNNDAKEVEQRHSELQQIHGVHCAFALHRSLHPDAPGLPAFASAILARAHAAAAVKAELNSSVAAFFTEVEATLRLLPWPLLLKGEGLPSLSYPVHLAVRVPYPLTLPTGSIVVLIDPVARAQSVQQLGQSLHLQGRAQLRQSWLRHAGLPVVFVAADDWWRLRTTSDGARMQALQRWVEEAVGQWEQRLWQHPPPGEAELVEEAKAAVALYQRTLRIEPHAQPPLSGVTEGARDGDTDGPNKEGAQKLPALGNSVDRDDSDGTSRHSRALQ